MAEGGRLHPKDTEDWVKIDKRVKYDRNRRLGGSRSCVYFGKFAVDANSTIDVAIKFIRKNDRSIREARCLWKLNHPNVITIRHCGECKELDYDFYVAMEICKLSLEELMKRNPDYCREHCQEIFWSVIEGLKCVHDKGIVHRDINPSNILLSGDGYIVVADFGFSKESDDVHRLETCSEKVYGCFIPPEMFNGQKASSMGDMYSAGAILFWLMTGGKHAYDIVIEHGIMKRTGSGNLSEIDINFHHDYELAKDLLSGLLKENPEDRISCSEVMRHALFLSDKQKAEFLKDFYTAMENLPNCQKDSEKKSIKQYLNEPAKEVTGEDWSSKMNLFDDEMDACYFRGSAQKRANQKEAIYRALKIGDVGHNQCEPGAKTQVDAVTELTTKNGPNPNVSPTKTSAKGAKPYIFNSPFSLLRMIRNLETHKGSEDITSIKKHIGLLKFIHRPERFPKFFLHIWDAVMRRFEDCEETRDLRSNFGESLECRGPLPLKDHEKLQSSSDNGRCNAPEEVELEQIDAGCMGANEMYSVDDNGEIPLHATQPAKRKDSEDFPDLSILYSSTSGSNSLSVSEEEGSEASGQDEEQQVDRDVDAEQQGGATGKLQSSSDEEWFDAPEEVGPEQTDADSMRADVEMSGFDDNDEIPLHSHATQQTERKDSQDISDLSILYTSTSGSNLLSLSQEEGSQASGQDEEQQVDRNIESSKQQGGATGFVGNAGNVIVQGSTVFVSPSAAAVYEGLHSDIRATDSTTTLPSTSSPKDAASKTGASTDNSQPAEMQSSCSEQQYRALDDGRLQQDYAVTRSEDPQEVPDVNRPLNLTRGSGTSRELEIETVRGNLLVGRIPEGKITIKEVLGNVTVREQNRQDQDSNP